MESVDIGECDGGGWQGPVLVQVAAVDPADQRWSVQRLHDVQHDPLPAPHLKEKKLFS